MKIVEQITTTKGSYSLNIQMGEDADSAVISISSNYPFTFSYPIRMRLDNEDLKRIYLLLGDHLEENTKDI